MSIALLDPESSPLAVPTAPIVFGLTAGGQPLIQNLVLSAPLKDFVPSAENKNLSPLDKGQLEEEYTNNQESILVLNGVSSDGTPIVQGVITSANIPTEKALIAAENDNQDPEEADSPHLVKTDPTVTPNNSEIGDSVFYIHGGLSNDGLPLIQGVVLLPEHYPEAPDAKTPPPSEAGEGDHPKGTEKEPSPEQPPENPEGNPNPEQDQNPGNPPEKNDQPVDNAVEEEFIKVVKINQGDYCCDQLSHEHLVEPVKTVDPPQAPPQQNIPSEKELSLTLSNILLNLAKLKMVNQPQYSSVVDKLRELEEEMKGAVTGLPPDPSLTDLISKVLAAEYPDADLQIIVSSSRKTTTTKSFYETETPGMVGLDPSALQDLHRKLMQNISENAFIHYCESQNIKTLISPECGLL